MRAEITAARILIMTKAISVCSLKLCFSANALNLFGIGHISSQVA
jgi:hypothetical protein